MENDLRRWMRLVEGSDQSHANFLKWFGDSKVVDVSGEPLIVYHGTSAKFSKFSKKRAIGSQFWFTSSKASIETGDVGAQGAGVIMPVYLSIQQPAGWKEYDQLMLGQIRSAGYDGIILPDGNDKTYVVFNPNQIKSVKNKGGWSSTSDSIYQ
jgi:ADP-Ribosyltransferase in polyvalent proteins